MTNKFGKDRSCILCKSCSLEATVVKKLMKEVATFLGSKQVSLSICSKLLLPSLPLNVFSIDSNFVVELFIFLLSYLSNRPSLNS